MSYLYTLDVFDALERFRAYHQGYAHPQVAPALQTEYLHMTVEQLIAHFDLETHAVQSFVNHYATLLTDPTVSPLFKYHPLKFLRQMENAEYQGYLYCLYGFAEDMLKLFQTHRLYSATGQLRASFQHIEHDTLYLIIRPEVSSVFLH